MTFDEYLRQPCDHCESTATHNQGAHKVCNKHIDPDKRAFARND